MRFIIHIAALFILAGCAAPSSQSGDGSARVDRTYSMVTYSLSSVPSVIGVAKASERNGKVRICAAFATLKSGTGFKNQLLQKFRERATFRMKGDRITAGGTFAPAHSVDERRDIVGKMSRCILTDAPWKPGYRNERVAIQAHISRIGD